MNEIAVSILCITYNHGPFIRDALESFVRQKTNFAFEVLIHDDASTDGTADIIYEYEHKYPHIFRCIYQKENIWGKKDAFLDFLMPMVRGKYVAINEGDDYWCDDLKLQKQFDFMEAHPEFSVCFHPVRVHFDNGLYPDSIFPPAKFRFNKEVLSLSDLLKHNFIQTNSVMYRWRFHAENADKLIPRCILPGDWYLHLVHAQIGKIGFLPEIMSVYRRHDESVWTNAMVSPQWFLKCGIANIRFYLEVDKNFGRDSAKDIADLALLTKLCLQKEHKFNELEILEKLCPQIPKYPENIALRLIFLSGLLRLTFVHSWRKKIKRRINFLKQLRDFAS